MTEDLGVPPPQITRTLCTLRVQYDTFTTKQDESLKICKKREVIIIFVHVHCFRIGAFPRQWGKVFPRLFSLQINHCSKSILNGMSGELSEIFIIIDFSSECFSHKPHLSTICLFHCKLRVSYDGSCQAKELSFSVGNTEFSTLCPAICNAEQPRSYPLLDEEGSNMSYGLSNSQG